MPSKQLCCWSERSNQPSRDSAMKDRPQRYINIHRGPSLCISWHHTWLTCISNVILYISAHRSNSAIPESILTLLFRFCFINKEWWQIKCPAPAAGLFKLANLMTPENYLQILSSKVKWSHTYAKWVSKHTQSSPSRSNALPKRRTPFWVSSTASHILSKLMTLERLRQWFNYFWIPMTLWEIENYFFPPTLIFSPSTTSYSLMERPLPPRYPFTLFTTCGCSSNQQETADCSTLTHVLNGSSGFVCKMIH